MPGRILQYTTIFVSVSLIILFQSYLDDWQDTRIYYNICKRFIDNIVPELFGCPAG